MYSIHMNIDLREKRQHFRILENSAIKSPFECLFAPNIVQIGMKKSVNREKNIVQKKDILLP